MKAYGEWRHSPLFLTSAMNEIEWSASRTCRFTPRKSLRYPLNRRVGGLQSRTGVYRGKKNLFPCQEENPGRPARIPVTIQTHQPRISRFLIYFVECPTVENVK
jgi:hypothetical protein